METWRFRSRLKYLLGNYRGVSHGKFTYFGQSVYFPRNCVLFKLACIAGIYERENLSILESLCPDHTTFFDVGANIGLMSIPMLASSPNRKVVSFEPSPSSTPYLLKSHAESPHQARWTIIQTALAEKSGTVDFTLMDPYTAGLEGMKSTGRAEARSVVKVPCDTLDSQWNKLNRPQVSLIKIDTEGADLSVLCGAAECLKANRSYILTEWNPKNFQAYGHEAGDLLTWAEQSNYTIFSVPSMTPITTAMQLKLTCLTCETFLLAPR